MNKLTRTQLTTMQLFIIMLLSSLFVTLMYMSPTGFKMNSSDLMLQIIIGAVLTFITAIPAYLLIRDDNSQGLLKRCDDASTAFGKTTAVIFLVAFLFWSMRTLVRFDVFVSTVIFPESDVRLFLLILVVCSLYSVIMGIDVLGRTAQIFVTLVAFSIIFVMVSTANRLSITNFTPMMYDGFYRPFQAGVSTMASCIELTYPLIFKDKIKSKPIVCVFPWVGVIMSILLVLTFWGAGVLGDFSNTQLFPVFSLTTLTSVGFLERLDVFLTAAWVVCVFVKIAICINIVQICIVEIFKSLSEKKAMIISAVVISILALMIRESYTTKAFVSNISAAVTVYAIIVVLVPVILISAEKMKKKASGNPEEGRGFLSEKKELY